ncbi:hypothetical protein BDR04DRAFT_1121867 [Suillus decipiens]|nr:hypothetical protein BDR04DRAFT_1121867 [Suillus decipiens]
MQEGKSRKDKPKKGMVREAVPPIANKLAWYDVQDDDIVMEDGPIKRVKELLGLLAKSIRSKTMVRKETHLVFELNKGNEDIAEGFNMMGSTKSQLKGALIELPIKIHRNNLKAVIDTGSQLNIVSEQMYEKFIKLPINWSKTLVLHDANGGTGHLKGLVSQGGLGKLIIHPTNDDISKVLVVPSKNGKKQESSAKGWTITCAGVIEASAPNGESQLRKYNLEKKLVDIAWRTIGNIEA